VRILHEMDLSPDPSPKERGDYQKIF